MPLREQRLSLPKELLNLMANQWNGIRPASLKSTMEHTRILFSFSIVISTTLHLSP